MTLTSDELEKIAKNHIKKESPDFIGVQPTSRDEELSIPQKVERKLGLEHSRKTPAKAKVFTFKKIVTAEDGARLHLVQKVTIDINTGKVVKSTGN